MSKLTKNQKIAYAKVEPEKAYKLTEAAALLKEITFTKFDASVDVDVRLGVDPRKANQMVRGVVTLPHGTGKQVRVLVLCTPEKEAEAQAAGADYVGSVSYTHLDVYKRQVRSELLFPVFANVVQEDVSEDEVRYTLCFEMRDGLRHSCLIILHIAFGREIDRMEEMCIRDR